MPAIVMRAPFDLARTQEQQGLRAVLGLNLRLLIHAQNQRLVWGRQVQADNIPHFRDEQRVRGKCKRLGAMGLQLKGAATRGAPYCD